VHFFIIYIESLSLSVADNTSATSLSLTAANSDSAAISSTEISSLPSSHRMSAYRSKYLRDKEQQQQQEEPPTLPSSKAATSSATSDVKNGKILSLCRSIASCRVVYVIKLFNSTLFSVLWHCWFTDRKGMWPMNGNITTVFLCHSSVLA